uniref:p-aminobenzoic acid synthase n=1 Tax=Eucampia antarctica TaxID=49252 RepID=A0A7S2W0K0_9STRA|mmetsp:Transcript_17130/g.16573  ORF Transcript_17130/g.16573 Transcript_17130/m.16573 type:complete len:967 (+) Transcript_17130:95-2995(+)|eukprot:CAMPEP_0197824750 /NCGR_PEP_ID=MMETSP1437-20131217/1970_1 /TAXON_ID=49252 ORGANISM="Eucampia antarctica, Strain CCMP1452" /NCGR_SAMPLE_ID=MMETSP1437 /ASSEMBLY_ACC=CAM_ASM_001096 /LENGTH=966 /DNA_ID=CAMNT_0043424505 /DNA_START=39 /DNA_END=2939 /DNA_ORIENTATION=+
MVRFHNLALLATTTLLGSTESFTALSKHAYSSTPFLVQSSKTALSMVSTSSPPDYNSVHVAKTGGRGAISSSQDALNKDLSLGAPKDRPIGGHFLTRGGVQITANVKALNFVRQGTKDAAEGSSAHAIEQLVDKLDNRKGVLFASSYEYPGRYGRWSLGFVDPPLEVSGKGQQCTITALNSRGEVILPAVIDAMEKLRADGFLESIHVVEDQFVRVQVVPPAAVGSFNEEDRSRQPSLFSVVRSLVDLFGYQDGDGQLGLYGAFGYDVTFQFEPIKKTQERDPEQRDILLYLPDEITVVDQDKRDAWVISYDFSVNNKTTQGLPRGGSDAPFKHFQEGKQKFQARDTPNSEFSKSVEKAKNEFAIGNLFEVVLSQTFREKLDAETKPSVLFRRLRARNPSPYGFFINLGEDEYLVGASPEMFVRCEPVYENEYRPPGVPALRVETCPISGTVARGADALEDAKRIRSLIMNQKEESELTMCTDVDRNDKSRICEPGSVKVIGRRQIEMYSRLIHTVDHVEGYLRENFDALDAFLCHTWAVTVTGAPKTWAIQFVEENERSPRCWYGAAVGLIGFDGSLNTGLTLRTVRVKEGIAEVRAGATLLYDSNPIAEEQETELKASAMLDAIVHKGPEDGVDIDAGADSNSVEETTQRVGDGKRIILIDHEDSFVHTLGNYLRQTGAEVKTLRSGPSALAGIEKMINDGKKPDMVVLSPGPGNPSDFDLSTSIDFLIKHKIPGFGVCLGLQGMVEYFGGTLGVLSYPMHGKPSKISLTLNGKADKSIFFDLPESFEVARYHSLYGVKDTLPACLEVTALTEDGIVMGIQHKSLPFAAVQFHPESILTSPDHGMSILENTLSSLRYNEEVIEVTEKGKMSGASIVGDLENKSVAQLKEDVKAAGLSAGGTKSELVVRLALWTHKSNEAKNGRLDLSGMSVSTLRELKQGLGLRGTATNKAKLIAALEECLGLS